MTKTIRRIRQPLSTASDTPLDSPYIPPPPPPPPPPAQKSPTLSKVASAFSSRGEKPRTSVQEDPCFRISCPDPILRRVNNADRSEISQFEAASPRVGTSWGAQESPSKRRGEVNPIRTRLTDRTLDYPGAIEVCSHDDVVITDVVINEVGFNDILTNDVIVDDVEVNDAIAAERRHTGGTDVKFEGIQVEAGVGHSGGTNVEARVGYSRSKYVEAGVEHTGGTHINAGIFHSEGTRSNTGVGHSGGTHVEGGHSGGTNDEAGVGHSGGKHIESEVGHSGGTHIESGVGHNVASTAAITFWNLISIKVSHMTNILQAV